MSNTFPNYIALDDTGTLMVAGSAKGDGASDAGDNTGDISLWSDTIIRGNTSYTDYTSDDIVINKTELEEFLNNGVDVTLKANTDITISSAITVTGTGSLNLHAGRDVNINSNINTILRPLPLQTTLRILKHLINPMWHHLLIPFIESEAF